MTYRHEELMELVPIHALDALTDEERRAVDDHLPECSECRRLLDLHYEAAAALVPEQPAPEGLWGVIAAELDATEPTGVAPLAPRRERRTPWPWVAGIAAALALVFAGLLGARIIGEGRLDGDAVVAAADAAARDTDAFEASFLVEGDRVARLVLADGYGYLIPDGLPALPDDRTYQLWAITPDERFISAGIFGSDPRPAVFAWDGEAAGFALTDEPAGGVVSSVGELVSVATRS